MIKNIVIHYIEFSVEYVIIWNICLDQHLMKSGYMYINIHIFTGIKLNWGWHDYTVYLYYQTINYFQYSLKFMITVMSDVSVYCSYILQGGNGMKKDSSSSRPFEPTDGDNIVQVSIVLLIQS